MRKVRAWRPTVFDISAFAMTGIAVFLVIGYMQSDTETRWTRCVVDATPAKTMIAGSRQWSSKRLFCENYRIVIAIKMDHELPLTKDAVLAHDTAVACSYDVARNPYHLFRDQVLTDSLDCVSDVSNDVG